MIAKSQETNMLWFGKKKPPPIRSLVGEGMVVHGHVRFADGMRIDGQVRAMWLPTAKAAASW